MVTRVGKPSRILLLVTITAQWTNQSEIGVKCKLCDKSFAGLTERMAAHFTKKPSYHITKKCTKATPEAVALGDKFLEDFEVKRATARKSKAEDSIIMPRQMFVRCKDNDEGNEAADNTFLRLLLAGGQSFSIEESLYFRYFVKVVTKVPRSTARDRGSPAGTDPDAKYSNIDVESKEHARMGHHKWTQNPRECGTFVPSR